MEIEKFAFEDKGTDMRVVFGKILAEPTFRKDFRANPKSTLKSAGFEVNETDLKLLHKGLTTNGPVSIGVEAEGVMKTINICNNCDCEVHTHINIEDIK